MLSTKVAASARQAAKTAKTSHDRVSIAVREHVFHEGDEARAIFEIVSGAVALYRTGSDGSRVIQGIRFPGEFIGYSRNGEYTASALAVDHSVVRRASCAALENVADPKQAHRCMSACSGEVDRLSDQIMILGSRSALGALAATLLDFSERGAGGAAVVTMPLLRSELADLIGHSLETVSRAMTKLRWLGAIDLPQPTVVRILNRQLLRDLAEKDGEGAARSRCGARSRA